MRTYLVWHQDNDPQTGFLVHAATGFEARKLAARRKGGSWTDYCSRVQQEEVA